MYVIIPVHGTGSSIEALTSVGGKPVLQHILDELYSYQEYIDDVIIMASDTVAVGDYVKFSQTDNFFRTKMHCLKSRGTIVQDIHDGVEHMMSHCRCGDDSRVLVWDSNVLVIDTRRFTDLALPSFTCVNQKKNEIGIWRFDDWVHLVNACVTTEKSGSTDISKLISEYLESGMEMFRLDDFGTLYDWKTTSGLLQTIADFRENDSKYWITADVNISKQQVTLKNKFINEPYSSETHEKNKAIQSFLFQHAMSLENATPEQRVYLPELISMGVTMNGDYVDEVTEEWIPNESLVSLLFTGKVGDWKTKTRDLCAAISGMFHIDSTDWEQMVGDIVPYKTRQRIGKEMVNVLPVLEKLGRVYSISGNLGYIYSMTEYEFAKWLEFSDVVLEESERHFGADEVIWQGTCDRLVLHTTLMRDVVYNEKWNTMKFLNSSRGNKFQVVDKNMDYVNLYLSAYTLYDVFEREKFIDTGSSIEVQEAIQRQFSEILETLDDIVGPDKTWYMRLRAISEGLKRVSETEELSDEAKGAYLKHLTKLRDQVIWKDF